MSGSDLAAATPLVQRLRELPHPIIWSPTDGIPLAVKQMQRLQGAGRASLKISVSAGWLDIGKKYSFCHPN
jgi:hypothetical protein